MNGVPDGWYFAPDGYGDLTLWQDYLDAPHRPRALATFWHNSLGIPGVSVYSAEVATWLRDHVLADVPHRRDAS